MARRTKSKGVLPDGLLAPIGEPVRERPTNVRAADYRYLYANNCILSPGAFDFSITFAQVRPDGEGGLINEAQVTVVVSPQHFKAIAKQFQENLQGYEEFNGEIGLRGAKEIPETVHKRLQQLIAATRGKALKMLDASDETTEQKQPSPPPRGAQKVKAKKL